MKDIDTAGSLASKAVCGMKKNDRADGLLGKAAISSDLPLGRPELLRSSRHDLRAQSKKKNHTQKKTPTKTKTKQTNKKHLTQSIVRTGVAENKEKLNHLH